MATPWPFSLGHKPPTSPGPPSAAVKIKNPAAGAGLARNNCARSGGGRTIATPSAARAGRPAAVRACGSACRGGLAAGASAVSIVIPTAAFQLKGAHGNQLAHLTAAFRTDREGRISDTLLNFKDFFTSIALILIHRHGKTSQLSILRLRRDRNFKQGQR